MAASSAACFGIYAGLFVSRNLTAGYCVAWICWAVVLFLTSRIGVFRIRSRQRLLSDALVYALGSALELVVWVNVSNTLNSLDLFDDSPIINAAICSAVPTLLHIGFIFFYMQMVVFRRVFHDDAASEPEAS